MTASSDEDQKRQQFTEYWLGVEPSVSAYVFAAIPGFHDAEDVVQKVAQELARRFEEYDPQRPFVGWALWITKSRVIDFYRARKRNRLVFSDSLLNQLSETIAANAEGRSQRREALESCLDGLPEKSRRLLDLRYVDELSAEQLGESIGATAGSARVLLTRVRGALADCVRRRLAMEHG